MLPTACLKPKFRADFGFIFPQFLQHQDLPGSVDMVVSILTMGYWPTYTPVEVHLPVEVLAHYVDF